MKNPYYTIEYDLEFNSIPELFYLPWVGKNYTQNNNSTLLIPESVYNWEVESIKRKEVEMRLNQSNFVRELILEHGIEHAYSKQILARNIERTFGVDFKNEQERIDFWEGIAFHELVQRPLQNNKDRPKKDDYKTGANVLEQVIAFLKPNQCLFFGTDWQKFSSFKEALNDQLDVEELHFDKINNANPKILNIKNWNTRIYFIKHPSKYYSSSEWKQFIENN